MYEPTDATFAVDLITLIVTAAAFLLIVAVTVRLRSPEARGLGAAAETLASLARELEWRKIKLALAAGVVLLAALGALVAYSTSDSLGVFVFRLNDERTLPTLYNTFQLFTAATLALLLARESRGGIRIAWALFALGFIGAGIDETSDMHARFEYRTGLREELALAPILILIAVAFVMLWDRLRAAGPALGLLIGGGLLIVASQAFDLSDAKWSQRIVEEALELGACALFVLSMMAALRFTVPREPATGFRQPQRDSALFSKTE